MTVLFPSSELSSFSNATHHTSVAEEETPAQSMDSHGDNLNHPLLQNDPFSESPSSQVLPPLWLPDSNSPPFHEPTMVNFRGIEGRNPGGVRRCRSAAAKDDEIHGGAAEAGGDDDEGDLGNVYRQPEKKRRLTPEQVQYLERSFEVENKLEPERKNHLAKELGLQPRQVAIWFQNRRARFKTKQLERDYDALKANFDSLKVDYDSLLMDKDKLQNEVSVLTTKLKQRERERGKSDSGAEPESAPQKVAAAVAALPCKQEEASSAKSDVLDSESPHCTDQGNYSSALETVNSSQAYVEPEQSDFSEEVENLLTRSFLPVGAYGFGKAEEEDGFHGSSGLPGLELEGQPSYWPCLY